MMMIAGAMEIVKRTRKMTDHTEAGVIPIIRNLIMTETGHQEETRAGHLMIAANLCTVTRVTTRDITKVVMMTIEAIQDKGHITKMNGLAHVVRVDLSIRIVDKVISRVQIIRVAAREGTAVTTGDLNVQNVIGDQAARECQTMMTTVSAGTARALMMI